MICAYSEGKTYPCGQCYPCRVNRQRRWLLRLLCEATQHSKQPIFVTLTYQEAPRCLGEDGNQVETLQPNDLTDWLKRLRWHVGEHTPGHTSVTKGKPVVRYYACGEYGKKTLRPHYHAILFGDTDLISHWLEKTWSHGFVTVRPADAVNMAYTLKYVLKDIGRLLDDRGVYPPFARMSQRPPLGTGFAKNIAQSIMPLMARDKTPKMVDFLGHLPPILQIDGKMLPLDRTMRNAVTNAMVAAGMPEYLCDLVFPPQEMEFDAEKTLKAQAYDAKARRNRNRETVHAV